MEASVSESVPDFHHNTGKALEDERSARCSSEKGQGHVAIFEELVLQALPEGIGWLRTVLKT